MRTRLISLLALATSVHVAACSAAHTPDVDAPTSKLRAEPASPANDAKPGEPVSAAPSESPREDALAKTAPEPAADTRPRMGSIGNQSYIYKHPAYKGLALGYIRMGTSVPLLSDKPVPGEGCKRGWYAVAPRGFVCLRATNTTLDLNDAYFRALEEVGPKKGEVWPFTYAFSNSAPMYSRVPTPEEQEKVEKKYGPVGSFVQLPEWSKGHEELILNADPIEATDPIPDIFAGGRRAVGGNTRDPRVLVWRSIPNGSMLSYAKAFAAEGRVWLLTPDLMLVPADRMRKLRRSTFHGVDLAGGVELPLAWNRTKGVKPKYRREADGSMHEINDAIPPKSWVAIEDVRVASAGKQFFPVKGQRDVFVAEDDVTVSRARKELPNGVARGEKWIEAKILVGTLTAYVGMTPVRATLFSPGKGGVPASPDEDHTKWATTAMGYFPLEWKDATATMTNEMGEAKLYWFSDVPHIQYLRAPLAMHVAFWHEDFGNPKSAECVNVSPEDGNWLFGWTDPTLPEGWGGMRPGDGNGKSTPVIVTAR